MNFNVYSIICYVDVKCDWMIEDMTFSSYLVSVKHILTDSIFDRKLISN